MRHDIVRSMHPLRGGRTGCADRFDRFDRTGCAGRTDRTGLPGRPAHPFHSGRPGRNASLIPIVVLVAALFVLLGCSSLPETRYYDIRLPDPPAAASAVPGAEAVPLVLAGVDLPSHLDLPEIFYRKSSCEGGFYEYHRWVRPLSESLGCELFRHLEKTGRFRMVGGPPAFGSDAIDPPLAGTAVLRVTVIEFNENDGDGERWTADVELRVRLGNLPGGGSRAFTLARSVPVERRNAAGTVEALNRAFAALAAELVDALSGELVDALSGELGAA